MTLGGKDDWLLIKLLYAKGGYGIIAAKTKESKIKISCS